MSVVVDASAMVVLLTDAGSGKGSWVGERLRGEQVIAPHLLGVEVAHTLRRITRSGTVTSSQASIALAEMVSFPIRQVGFAPVAARVWELRDSVSSYDAWYVAVAEAARAPLVTLDARLARAPGLRCAFSVPPL